MRTFLAVILICILVQLVRMETRVLNISNEYTSFCVGHLSEAHRLNEILEKMYRERFKETHRSER